MGTRAATTNAIRTKEWTEKGVVNVNTGMPFNNIYNNNFHRPFVQPNSCEPWQICSWKATGHYNLFIVLSSGAPQHIDIETKWPPFSRRHLQMPFLEWNVWISIKISSKLVPKGPINNIPALVRVMARCGPGDKPLSEPMFVWFTDAYIPITELTDRI